jgi:hypothetical protein
MVNRSRSSIPFGQCSASAVSGGSYGICVVSGIVGIFAGARFLSIEGLSLFALIYPLIGVLIGWLSAAVMGAVVETLGFLAMPHQPQFNYQPPTSPQDLMIWATGSDENSLQAKQMLIKTTQSNTEL